MGDDFINNLINHASKSQKSLINLLNNLEVQYKSYWIANFIQVSTSFKNALKIANHSNVIRLEPNRKQKRLTTEMNPLNTISTVYIFIIIDDLHNINIII